LMQIRSKDANHTTETRVTTINGEILIYDFTSWWFSIFQVHVTRIRERGIWSVEEETSLLLD
jgi:hypothetical protein